MSVVDRLADAATAGLGGVLGALPEPAARATGRALGRGAFSVLRIRRRVVERQIAASFPERHPLWVQKTARACYRHFGEELAVLARPTPDRVRRLLERVSDPRGAPEMLREHARGDRGAVIVTGHLGNWELAGAYLAASDLPVTAVVVRQRGAFDRRIRRTREELGIESVYRGEPTTRLLRALRSGRVVALVADQHAARHGAPVPFFGRPAATFLGPARLSIACRVPLFFAALLREGEGYRALIERVRGAPGGPPSVGTEDELDLTAAWVARLETAIRAYPSQYFWFHRRWKLERSGRGSGGARPPGPVSRRAPGEGGTPGRRGAYQRHTEEST